VRQSPHDANFSNFLGVDHNEVSHGVQILFNSTNVEDFTIQNYGQKAKFHFSAQVKAGDTITFLSSYPGDWTNLSTGLQVTIVLR
jgi:hypothetical protein